MIEFSTRLKKLMEENHINAENLSKNIKENLNKKISANTIRSYVKGEHFPNSIENIQILAKYFKVSVDYIQGYTNEKTTNVKIKNICNNLGLTKKSLKALKRTMIRKKDFKDGEYNIYTTTDTINFLLEDLEENKIDSILYQIHTYFNAYSDYSVTIPTNVNKNNKKVFETAQIKGEDIIQYILNIIEYKLKEARKIIQEKKE